MEFKPWAQWCVTHKVGWLLNIYVFLIGLPVMVVAEIIVGGWRALKTNWGHALKVNRAINEAKKARA